MAEKLREIWSLSDWRKRDWDEPPLIPVKDEPFFKLPPYQVVDQRLTVTVLGNEKRRLVNPKLFKKGNQAGRRRSV